MNDGLVNFNQEPIDGVFSFGNDFPAHEIAHEYRHNGEREQGGGSHGIGFRVGQRFKQAPFLGLQGKYRKERHRDDEQRVKERRTHFFGGIDDNLPVIFLPFIPLDMLVGILNHYNGGIHHGANGDGNAAQGHDVGVDSLVIHHQKGHQNSHG